MSEQRPPVAEQLHLEPHPEGGWFAQTFKAAEQVTVDHGSGTEQRSAATLINFYLPAGESSAWHRVRSTEIWIWQGPGPILLQLGGSGDRPTEDPVSHRLGPDFGAGDLAQLIIPPGAWQRTLPGEQDALASCLVSPGFEFSDFTLAAEPR